MTYAELYEVNEAINELNDLKRAAEKEQQKKNKEERKRNQAIKKATKKR